MLADVETVVDSGLEVFAQNVETVRRLTHPVRDPRAGYEQTLRVLEHAKRHKPERAHEDEPDARPRRDGRGDRSRRWIDLRAVNVDILTLGQYLRPTVNHLPVQRFVTPEEFDRYREWALARGFLECVSGPLVRSSYRAEQALNRNNAGLDNSALARRSERRSGPSSISASSSTSRRGAPCSASPTSAPNPRPTRSGSSSIRRCSRWA